MRGVADIVLGLQYGSEGKGKVAAYLSKKYNAMVRSGGPQAGHSFFRDGIKYINRQIPCGVFSDCMLYISPTALINLEVLKDEIRRYGLTPRRLLIDRNAGVVSREDIQAEKESMLDKKIASTCEGVGMAQIKKILRLEKLFGEVVKNSWLEEYCGDSVAEIHRSLKDGKKILIEGTQGFGLCLNHGTYPFVTSRDVTSSALLNDSGISPKDCGKIIGVLRTYPIRVGGNSGQTNSKELNWAEITKRSNSPKQLSEYTTVTGRLRRVFEQDYLLLEKAIDVNRPDELALMFLDYINFRDFGKQSFDELSEISKKYVYELEERLKTPIRFIGTGPEETQMIYREG
jgi:adenylosuccinate synthase